MIKCQIFKSRSLCKCKKKEKAYSTSLRNYHSKKLNICNKILYTVEKTNKLKPSRLNSRQSSYWFVFRTSNTDIFALTFQKLVIYSFSQNPEKSRISICVYLISFSIISIYRWSALARERAQRATELAYRYNICMRWDALAFYLIVVLTLLI